MFTYNKSTERGNCYKNLIFLPGTRKMERKKEQVEIYRFLPSGPQKFPVSNDFLLPTGKYLSAIQGGRGKDPQLLFKKEVIPEGMSRNNDESSMLSLFLPDRKYITGWKENRRGALYGFHDHTPHKCQKALYQFWK